MWHAYPLEAQWYGEVIFSRRGETDYNYGYAKGEAEPEPPTELAPDDADIIEWTVRRLPYKSGDAS